MAITPGDVGSGSTLDICSVTPSDRVGQLDNVLDRLERLESVLSQLLGGNVQANQLDEIAQNTGWLYVDYMGRPGWQQNPVTGTLIPPPGVTFHDMGLGQLVDYPCNPYDSSGNLKPGLRMSVYDSDGNLQLGTDCGGNLQGAKVNEWDAGGARDYYVYRLNDDVSQGRGITLGSNTYSTGAGVYTGSARFTVSREGLYLVNQSATWVFSGGTAVNTLLAAKADMEAGTPLPYTLQWLTRNNEIEWLKTIYGQTFQDPIGDLLHVNQSELLLLQAGGRVTSSMTAYALPGANLPADIHFLRVNFSIVHLTTTA